ncbi:suppression of tumorigenicity 5 protein isoform x4 [Pitangus sulphuratus]|nr:suppression of tumorigenicity 5 protein isoform x4 [Pitangus sulphuratus]
MPATSKTDPLLAKAKPISDGGSTSVVTYLRRWKSYCLRAICSQRVRIFERNNSADTKVSEGEGGGTPGAREEIPLQPVVKTMVRQAVPLKLMEVHSGASECSKEAMTLWEAHTEAGSWKDLWTHGERSLCWSRFSGRTCDPVGVPCWSSLFLKDCTLWKGPMLEKHSHLRSL